MRILVVDDEQDLTFLMADALDEMGFEVMQANKPSVALELTDRHLFDLVITDIRMPEMSGLELVPAIRQNCPQIDFIVMTAFGTLDGAITAIKLGVSDFLSKPFTMEQLGFAVEKVCRTRRLRDHVHLLESELASTIGPVEFIGAAPCFKKVIDEAMAVASSDATVLIRGETGAGKELMARYIHQYSERADGPFVCVDCASLPPQLMESELFGYEKGAFSGANERKRGRVEYARGGTIFLDEIGELEGTLQAKLLRFLDEKTFSRLGGDLSIEADVRIVAATNRDLEALIAKGDFREDLFFRLNVVSLKIPPLRDRVGDVELLASYFLKKFTRKTLRINPKAMDMLKNYSWPGNVRELRNVLERAYFLNDGEEIGFKALPLLQDEGWAERSRYDVDIPPQGFSVAELEKAVILKALSLEKGVKSKAARRLGLTRGQLDTRLKRYKLNV